MIDALYKIFVRQPARVVAKELVEPILALLLFFGIVFGCAGFGNLIFKWISGSHNSSLRKIIALIAGIGSGLYAFLFIYEMSKALHL